MTEALIESRRADVAARTQRVQASRPLSNRESLGDRSDIVVRHKTT